MKVRRTSVDDEVNDELTFHLEMTVRELMEQGMTRKAAQTEAERRFGDALPVGDECRRYARQRDEHARRVEYREELKQDLAFATRQLLKARGFTAVAVLTLALGIGATAAVFSVLDAVVLRPLPFDHADRVMTISPMRHGEKAGSSAPDFLALRKVSQFEYTTAAVLQAGFTIRTGERPATIGGGHVSADYFRVFGVQPAFGRWFTAEEDQPGHDNVVVLSHRIWVSHFNSDRGIVGRRIDLDGRQMSVIGVAPASFDIANGSEDVWTPLALTPDQATKYSERYLQILGRLRPDVTVAQATAAATASLRAMAEQMPQRASPVSDYSAALRSYADSLVGDYRSLFLILLAAVFFVLLIGCTNVANLLLARGSVRAKELAIRTALGAGRARLVRQLLTESLVLALAGSVAALGVAFALIRLILAVSPQDIPRLDQARLDWRVFAFTLGIGLLSSVLFGLLPALRAAGRHVEGTLRQGGRNTAATRDRTRNVLVAAEVALAITLLVGAGLLIRSAMLVQRIDPGFDARGVLAARLMLPQQRYPDGAAVTRAYSQILNEAKGIPGARSAAIVSVVPLSGSQMHSSVIADGAEPDASSPEANLRLASAGYFATMGIPLRAGRDLSAQDVAGTPLVVVVNEALAKRLWPTLPVAAVLGHRINAMSAKRDEPHSMEVVGVVGDLHDAALSQAPEPEFYAPFEQTPEFLWPFIQRSLVVVVKARSVGAAPETLVRPVERAVATIDQSLPLAEARSMESYMSSSLQTARMNTLLLSTLGGIALVLAVVGIYGVVSYFVSQRTHEIGVRMALGASPKLIWQFVLRRGFTPIVLGLVIGLGLSTLTTTVLRGQLYGISNHDPATISAVTVLLVLVAMVATVGPARRAMRISPLRALNDG